MKTKLLRNRLTGKYWDGSPAPLAFDAGIETAKAVDSVESAFIKATYENVEEVPATICPDEILRAAYAALPITEKTTPLLKAISALF